MDQSNRYADLSLSEEDLIKGGRHILVAYKMAPKSGYGYLEAAAHFAAESSTGTNVEVSTTDDFTRVWMRWCTTSTKPPRTCALPTPLTCLTAM
jgi:ribulose 1,5-bisphosphate carboxylase large subunit-like protein